MDTKFESLIHDFCRKLSTHYNLPEDELFGMWTSSSSSSPSTSSTSSSSSSFDLQINEEKILKASKDVLVAMCRSLKLKITGKKEELTQRLMNHLKSSSSSSSSSSKKAKTEVVPPVIKKLQQLAVKCPVTRNRWGNYEHVATKLVFQKQIVVGKQMDNGEIAPLSLDDIEICKREKLQYKPPEKLVSDMAMESIKLDDDDEEEEEILEEEIELEDEAVEDDDDDDK